MFGPVTHGILMPYPIFNRPAEQPPSLQVERPKRRDAELNSKWGKFAASYLRKNPFCAECARHGRDIPARVVDHIVPRKAGGSLWSTSNLQPLCDLHHNTTKRDLERLALEAGDLQLLLMWMARPETRPGRLAFRAVEQEDFE